ncbi:MAG: hypothetical protein KKB20_27985 [Proteobacteria bacterium]|nr:hypothetical protein [Pseudomonadota bacterium]
MPRKKVVDSAALIEAVKTAGSTKEIMERFGIKTSGQLKATYVDALVEQGKIMGIVTGKKTAAEPVRKSKALKINNRGSLIIPKEVIDEMGFVIGDLFSVGKSLAGVSLKRK